MSVDGWRSFGVVHEPVKDSRDMSAMARAINLLSQCDGATFGSAERIDWYDATHEFWILPCPCAQPFVCVRPGTNPFDCGYVISPIPMPHLKCDAWWEKTL